MKKSLNIGLLLSIIFSTQLFGQENKVYSVDELVQEALIQNLSLRIEKINKTQSETQVTYGNAGMLPSISFSSGYTSSQNTNVQEYITGEKFSRTGKGTNLRGGISVNYTLFDGLGMYKRLGKLRENATLASLNLRDKSEQIIVELNALYYDALKTLQDIRNQKLLIQLDLERIEYQKALSKSGKIIETDVLKTKSDMSTDSSLLLSLENQYEQYSYQLSFLSTGSARSDLMLDTALFLNIIDSDEILISQMKANNVLIRKLAVTGSLTELDYELYRSNWYPRIGLSAGINGSDNKNAADLYKVNRGYGYSAGANINWDIYTGGQRRNQIEVSKMEMDKVALQQTELEKRLIRDMKITYSKYIYELRRRRFETENYERHSEYVARVNELYKYGRITDLEVRQAQLDMIAALGRVNTSLLNAKKLETELFRISGGLLD